MVMSTLSARQGRGSERADVRVVPVMTSGSRHGRPTGPMPRLRPSSGAAVAPVDRRGEPPAGPWFHRPP